MVKGVTVRAVTAIVVARGARAAEEVVITRVLELHEAARTEPALLGKPVVVVVPSRSLRRHLAAALVSAAGRSLAGVRLVTLHGLALEILERVGERARGGAVLLPVLVRRAARRLGPLRAALEPLEDGYAVLSGTVRDLLDAGFTADHAEFLDERLGGTGEDEPPVARARAIVQVATEVHAAIAECGIGRSSSILSRAAELLRSRPDEVLPARALVVHGFAEATGVASDLLEEALRACGGTVVIDEPPDPVEPERTDPGAVFTSRLRERLEGVAGGAGRSPGAASVAERVEMFRAPGAFAEAREVAERVRALLDGGARPEGIGVVARDLGGREIQLHQHFERLAVPYSVEGGRGLAGPVSRRLSALAALIAGGPEGPAEAWFEVTGRSGSRALDMRLAARIAALTTVEALGSLDVAALVGDRPGVVLPVARGGGEIDGEGDARRPKRRFVAAAAIERARDEAAAWLEGWRSLPRRGAAPAQLTAVGRLALAALPRSDVAVRLEAGELLAGLAADVEGTVEIERDEALAVAAEALRQAGRTPAGGQGAGVQVLGIVEARGRTFEHLFLVGLNRDVFPRVVREDPLLPDRLRRALAVLLPDLPLKRTGFDEERYLFAQALTAAPHVTLSWLECDDDGRTTPPSPLVERLLLEREGAPDLVADLYSPARAVGRASPRPAHEHLVLAGLFGTRGRFGEILPAALGGAGVRGQDEVARVRRAVLDELDPDGRTRNGREIAVAVGPYLGFVGAASSPRRGPGGGDVSVTTLQDVAACPWQTFLRRLLRLEPPPEPSAALPAADKALIGSTVHRVLEVLVSGREERSADALAEVLLREPRTVEWPAPAELDVLARQAATDVLRAEGVHLPGLARALAAAAMPFLAVARSLDESDAACGALAAEVVGEAAVADGRGGERLLVFRADRVEAVDGRRRLVDFKIGTPNSTAGSDKGKRKATVGLVASGEWLQAPVYTRAGVSDPPDGRYVFLSPEIDDARRSWTVGAGDPEIGAALDAAAAVLLAAWDTGAFIPRLVDRKGRKEPRRCGWCPVRSACLAGDSGARRRLVAWAAGGPERQLDDAQRAALAVWRLGGTPVEGGE